MLKTKLNQI